MLSFASDKAKFFAKNFSEKSNLDDSGICLPAFPSKTNLALHNISLTSKMIKKDITTIDSLKASGPDCIPVVILKNYEPEILYIPAKLFNICLKESFNRSGATRAVAIDISNAFNRVWHAGLLHKLRWPYFFFSH